MTELPEAPAVQNFDGFSLHPDLLRAVREMGFVRPTLIQSLAIGPILAGKDLIGSAPTGSGKTAAFFLPIFTRMLAAPVSNKPAGWAQGKPRTRVLVLVPTRELALQVGEMAQELARFVKIRTATVFGGVGMEPQTKALRSGTDVVAATPGRLLDHLGVGNARLDRLEYLILDEADRMLDIGFLPDIMRIVERLPRDRQTLLFSATMPPAIVKFAATLQRDAMTVSAGEVQERPKIPVGIAHRFYPVPSHRKGELLLRLLQDNPMLSVLVFTRTKIGADQVANALSRSRERYRVGTLHSNRSQSERLQALAAFREGKTQILVATDIAARGLDISDITHVVNYDLPVNAEDYVHRVGRTGRADATGEAMSLVSIEEMPYVAAIERLIGQPVPRVTYPGFMGTSSATADPEKGTADPVVYTPPARIPAHRLRRPVRRRR